MARRSMVKIFTIANVPEELAQNWLQHLRDFDTAHPGCHFEALAVAPEMSNAAVAEALALDPPFKFFTVIKNKAPT